MSTPEDVTNDLTILPSQHGTAPAIREAHNYANRGPSGSPERRLQQTCGRIDIAHTHDSSALREAMIKRLLTRWLILAIAVGLTAWLMPGVALHGWLAPFWVSALFATVNLVVGSLVRLITAPLMLLTLGLFGLVVNGLMFRVTSWLTDDLTVSGFGTAFLAGLVVTVIAAILRMSPLGRPTRKGKAQSRAR